MERGIERRDAHAATRKGDDQMLGFELAKGFANRDMARVEFARHVVLAERRVRLECAGDDARSAMVSAMRAATVEFSSVLS